MSNEEIDDRVDLDKVGHSKSARIKSVVPFGMADLHKKGKIEFTGTETSNSITVSPRVQLPHTDDKFFTPNPDSFYLLLIYNEADQETTVSVSNVWEDVDGNSRESELTTNGHVVSAQSSDIIPLEGLFCGNEAKIKAEVSSQEGSAWNLYFNVYRP